MIDLVRELDDPLRRRDPELEVEIELVASPGFAGVRSAADAARSEIDDMLLDPWFQRSEAEIALIEDDPDAQVHEIYIAARAEAFDYL